MLKAKSLNLKVWPVGLIGVLLALVLLVPGHDSSASSGPIVSVDASPDASNTATSVGAIDGCSAVATGATVETDVVIQSVASLTGLEARLLYDPALLRVTGVSYDFLLGTTESSLLDLGDPVPDTDGSFKLGAVTFPLTAVSGSGVLVRVTLEGLAEGMSVLDLSDVKLADALGDPIQPADSSGVYLGTVNDAALAIGGACGDADLDGYADADEVLIGTDPGDNCGQHTTTPPIYSLAWPSDVFSGTSVPETTDKVTIGDLASFVAPVRYLGTNVGTNPGDARWDLSPGPGLLSTDISVLDLSVLIAGPTGYPPMLGGQRAFSGPACSDS